MKTPGRALFGLLLFTLFTGLTAGSARAHQFWLAPSSYDGTPGRPVSVSAFAGTGFRGEAMPWSPAHGVRFVVRTARLVDLTPAAAPGETNWSRFVPTDGGGAMFAFESGFTGIQLAAAPFDAYLLDEGLTAARSARSRAGEVPGRERYRRCPKAWIAGTGAARATAPIGLPLEIVPLAVPGFGPMLPIRVVRDGRPLAGALVKTWRSPLGAGVAPSDAAIRDSVGVSWKGRTDVRGTVTVPVPESGEWLISVVDMVPCREKEEADWESTWASLTFARGR